MKFFNIAAVLMAVLLVSAPVPANEGGKSFRTFYSTVYYPDDAALREFGGKIGEGPAVLMRDPEKAEALIKEKVDKIVFRVKTLLDMYPSDLNFNVRVYFTQDELKVLYKEKGIMGHPPIAFYSHKSHTIYLSIDKLSDGIFAHEVAHAVINSYFPVPPPAQMQEILAQYVDKHLWDE